MAEPLTVFLFRDDHFSGAGDTVVSAAPAEAVAAVFGGGGFRESEGVAAAFGGAAVYLDDERACCWLAVWGRRKASRFRAALRAGGFALTIRRAAPPGRLVAATRICARADERPFVILSDSEGSRGDRAPSDRDPSLRSG